MKTISNDLKSHIAQTVTTLATIWKITRTDGQSFYLTEHDVDLEVDGNTYKSASGYRRTAVSNSLGLAADNLDVHGVFDGGGITENDLRLGLFDYADVWVSLVNWSDLAQGAMKVRRGKLGEVSINTKGMYQAELRGLTQLLSQNIIEVYTAECRVDLGSTQCKIPVQPAILGRDTAVAVGEFYRVPTKTLTGVDWHGIGANAGFGLSSVGEGKTTIEGWTVLSGLWNVWNFHNGLSPDSGSTFLSGGASSAGSMEQITLLEDVGLSTDEIDAGTVTCDFSMKRANQTAIANTGRIIVQFRNASGAILSTPLDTTAEAISPEDTWVNRGFTGTAVPVGTRQIRVQLSYAKVSGTYADTSFDTMAISFHETGRTNTFQDIYEDRIYEVTTAGTTAGTQPSYDTTIGNPTTDGTAVLTARDSWMRSGYVSEVQDTLNLILVVADAKAVDDWYNHGVIALESGANVGRLQEAKTWVSASGALSLFLPLPFGVVAGNKIRIYPGCDKRLTTCQTKFNNVVNFRGFPYIPGADEAFKYADLK